MLDRLYYKYTSILTEVHLPCSSDQKIQTEIGRCLNNVKVEPQNRLHKYCVEEVYFSTDLFHIAEHEITPFQRS